MFIIEEFHTLLTVCPKHGENVGLVGELERSDVPFQVILRDTNPRQPRGIVGANFEHFFCNRWQSGQNLVCCLEKKNVFASNFEEFEVFLQC